MNLNLKTIGINVFLVLLPTSQVLAQGWQGLLGGGEKKDAVAANKEAKLDPDAIMLRGTGILVCLALANERAIAAQDKMLVAFSPDKLAVIQEKSEKYNEAMKKRKASPSPDVTMLGEENQRAADYQAAVAKLMEEKVTYKKGYGKQAAEAYTQVGWAAGIDLLAVAQVPGFLNEAQALIQSLGSNPLQLKKIKGATALVTTLGAAAKILPSQVAAFKTVRTKAKQIAQAEKATLKEPTPVTSLTPKLLDGTGGKVEG